MYRKELITSEIQRLGEVLAKIMQLKLEGKFEEAHSTFVSTMENAFGLPIDILNLEQPEPFSGWLTGCNLPPEKLDSMSEFLYYELGLSPERNKLIAPKLNLVYQYLSAHHKIVHLVNFHRQQTIQQYI